jgi:DNA-binding GntR family transcriptional regulator
MRLLGQFSLVHVSPLTADLNSSGLGTIRQQAVNRAVGCNAFQTVDLVAAQFGLDRYRHLKLTLRGLRDLAYVHLHFAQVPALSLGIGLNGLGRAGGQTREDQLHWGWSVRLPTDGQWLIDSEGMAVKPDDRREGRAKGDRPCLQITHLVWRSSRRRGANSRSQSLDKVAYMEYTSRMQPGRGELSGAIATSDQAANAVYLALREDIANGFLQPGEELLEVRLAKRFGVSRTPVREALIRLAADGVVVNRERRAAVVRAITPRDVVEILQLREAIEGHAITVAGARIDRPQLDELDQGYQSLERQQNPEVFLYTTDTRLHRLIVDALGNQRVTSILEQHSIQLAQLRSLFWRMADPAIDSHMAQRREAAADEHHAMVRCLLAGEYERAHDLLIEHFRHARDDLIYLLSLGDSSGGALAPAHAIHSNKQRLDEQQLN